MSAILSADDLNDFISPGVACIKPVETLPAAAPSDPSNPYEVRNEDKAPTTTDPAKISLTDCLACSGCVTSAEAVLVQLQSVREVLDNLVSGGKDKTFVALVSPQTVASLATTYGVSLKEARNMVGWLLGEGSKVGVEGKVPLDIDNTEGQKQTVEKGFRYVLDTDLGADVALVYAFEEVWEALQQKKTTTTSTGTAIKQPILTSACPGFICYAEAVHPYLLSHLSRLKSPQAILGTLVKTLLPRIISQETGKTVGPEDIYVLGIQPCFDKKLEGARGELTNLAWSDENASGDSVTAAKGVRDVDCVITTRELIQFADECGIPFSGLPRSTPPLPPSIQQSPSSLQNLILTTFAPSLTLNCAITTASSNDRSLTTGTSGGYLLYILARIQQLHPGSYITITKGRNSDTVEYCLFHPSSSPDSAPEEIVKFARSYGFRNIQNLVRKLKPQGKRKVLPRFGKKGTGAPAPTKAANVGEGEGNNTGYAYVEVMACPGGCTNGGGQVKFDDTIIISSTQDVPDIGVGENVTGVVQRQREWLSKVDEAYWSDDSSTSDVTCSAEPGATAPSPATTVTALPQAYPLPETVKAFVDTWSQATGIPVKKLLYTSYRKVEDEFSREKEEREREKNKSATVRAAELATKAGGGW